MQDLTLQHFAEHLNKHFTVATEHGDTAFTLMEARPLSTPLLQGMTRSPFSLLFHNASQVLFPQGIYRMGHPDIGEVEIFLVPVARHEPGFVYQAVFN
jgi:hypothetical protein